MSKLNLIKVKKYVEDNIGDFHAKRLHKLNKLSLRDVLKKKNPYLFKAKHMEAADEIVRAILNAYLSSSEETMFGDWLEGLAIHVSKQVYGGRKSGIDGIDLEFDNGGVRYIVNIKSGPNWGNSSQQSKMKEQFRQAKRVLRTSGSKLQVEAVNGCCYGRDDNPHKTEYQKLCGQRFWEFISGDAELYVKMIEPLGHEAKQHNDQFNQAYAQVVNRFVREFTKEFCATDGAIDWAKLARFNSAISQPKKAPRKPSA